MIRSVWRPTPHSFSTLFRVTSSSQCIRDHLAEVENFRFRAKSDPKTFKALQSVKAFQAARFRSTYRDLLAGEKFRDATLFFLNELYGERDFSQRDQQFFRIAGALEKFFPSRVVQTASDLASLHALSEGLDFQMAVVWASQDPRLDDAHRYAIAWSQVSSLPEREKQLATVMNIGEELDRLTRLPALRFALRMMRGPAKSAGLGALQDFLESGFDTFAKLAKNGKLATQFLGTIQSREHSWITALFSSSTENAANQLNECLMHA